jgi:serine/alanine adding enzyme
LSLASDPDELWQSFDPKVRNQIRKAKKSGLISVHGRQELLDDFWHVWSIRMSQLGTPCYPLKLFYNILETFPENTKIFLVRLNERTIGGAFVYCFKGFVQMCWAATLIEYNKLCPNNLLYWSVMQHYCLIGASCFDFGRTTVGGTQYKFKKQWGSQQVQLYYQYWSAPGHNYSPMTPDNPKYRKKVEMWKKLPLCVTRLIGPHISSSLP